MWAIPKTLFWPFMGLNFPKNYTDYTGMEYLIRMIKNSFTFSFSYSSISEVLGMGVIVILILHWLIKRFGQSKI